MCTLQLLTIVMHNKVRAPRGADNGWGKADLIGDAKRFVALTLLKVKRAHLATVAATRTTAAASSGVVGCVGCADNFLSIDGCAGFRAGQMESSLRLSRRQTTSTARISRPSPRMW